MGAHEMYVSGENEAYHETEDTREMQRENMLQLAWFEYMCRNMSAAEIEEAVDRIVKKEPSEERKTYVMSSLVRKKEAILQELIDPVGSTFGSEERKWFRVVFPNHKDAVIGPVYKQLLDRFRHEPDEVLEELDALFHRDTTKH